MNRKEQVLLAAVVVADGYHRAIALFGLPPVRSKRAVGASGVFQSVGDVPDQARGLGETEGTENVIRVCEASLRPFRTAEKILLFTTSFVRGLLPGAGLLNICLEHVQSIFALLCRCPVIGAVFPVWMRKRRGGAFTRPVPASC